jgi:hypothetical protein
LLFGNRRTSFVLNLSSDFVKRGFEIFITPTNRAAKTSPALFLPTTLPNAALVSPAPFCQRARHNFENHEDTKNTKTEFSVPFVPSWLKQKQLGT